MLFYNNSYISTENSFYINYYGYTTATDFRNIIYSFNMDGNLVVTNKKFDILTFLSLNSMYNFPYNLNFIYNTYFKKYIFFTQYHNH